MMLQTWGEVFTMSLQGLWLGFISFVPSLIVALIVFILGWVLADIIGRAIKQVVDALKINQLFASAGADAALSKAGLRLDVGAFLGGLVKWFIIIVFLMTALEIVGLTQVNLFLRDGVLAYLPQVIIAALILIAATLIADAMAKLVLAAAKTANLRSAGFLAGIVKYAIWIFALIVALAKLGIAPEFMQILFTGLVAALALALGLAFGLGGRDAAARTIEHFRAPHNEH
jgi:small-conductance mechanosensitive channel